MTSEDDKTVHQQSITEPARCPNVEDALAWAESEVEVVLAAEVRRLREAEAKLRRVEFLPESWQKLAADDSIAAKAARTITLIQELEYALRD